MNRVFVILGPTSSGKTSVALDLCKKFGGDIISVDSRQVVKFMDIGTGKIPIDSTITLKKIDTKWILDGVNVWGYDLTAPDEYFSAYDYAEFALKKITELLQQGKNIFLVGGTGFYIDIVTGKKVLAGTKPDFELRKSLESMPTKNLHSWLMSLNLDIAGSIDSKNRTRLIRALEIELAQEKINTTPLPFLKNTQFSFFGLTASRELLYSRVDAWVNSIWKNGLLDEVQMLISKGYKDTKPLNGLVYKTTAQFIDGTISEADAIQRIKFDLHAYIRRQQTYFRKNGEMQWTDMSDLQDLNVTISSLV